MQDLWPTEMPKGNAGSPANLLRKQAKLLAERTEGRLAAELRHVPREELEDVPEELSAGSFRYEFLVTSPKIPGYRFKLLRLVHDMNLYPVFVYPFDNAKAELWPNTPGAVLAESEADFLEKVKSVLRSGATQKVITGILSQLGQ